MPLADGVPVFITYLTVRPEEDGRIAYAADIYGLDSDAGEGTRVGIR